MHYPFLYKIRCLAKGFLSASIAAIIKTISAESIRSRIIRNQIAYKWRLVDFINRLKSYDSSGLRECPLCEYQTHDYQFKKLTTRSAFGGGQLLRHVCPGCDVIFGPDKMFKLTEIELLQEYEKHYSVYQEGDSTDQELRAFYALKPVRGGVYLNYGAGGWSKSVQKLRSAGWKVYAYEPHDSASPLSDWWIKDPIVLCSMKFDGIFTNNVLEHFRYPVRELAMMSKLLKRDGLMAHATPCFEYLYEYTRFHLYFFTGRSRLILMKNAGLNELNYITDQEFMYSVSAPIRYL